MPLTGTVFLMAMLAIIGMPPFSLFQSEFLIVQAALRGRPLSAERAVHPVRNGHLRRRAAARGRAGAGPGRGGVRRSERHPWQDASVLALAGVLVVIGFWLPAPLLELIRGAARVVAGE